MTAGRSRKLVLDGNSGNPLLDAFAAPFLAQNQRTILWDGVAETCTICRGGGLGFCHHGHDPARCRPGGCADPQQVFFVVFSPAEAAALEVARAKAGQPVAASLPVFPFPDAPVVFPLESAPKTADKKTRLRARTSQLEARIRAAIVDALLRFDDQRSRAWLEAVQDYMLEDLRIIERELAKRSLSASAEGTIAYHQLRLNHSVRAVKGFAGLGSRREITVIFGSPKP